MTEIPKEQYSTEVIPQPQRQNQEAQNRKHKVEQVRHNNRRPMVEKMSFHHMSRCGAKTNIGELLPISSAASKTAYSTVTKCPHPECPIPLIAEGIEPSWQLPKELPTASSGSTTISCLPTRADFAAKLILCHVF